MNEDNAKAVLKDLLSTKPDDVAPPEGGSSAPVGPEAFHRKFAEDLESMPVDVPFKMFFVQHGGEIRNAAIIPEHVLNNLKERDPEANEMFTKFNDPTEMGVAFAAAGTNVVFTGNR